MSSVTASRRIPTTFATAPRIGGYFFHKLTEYKLESDKFACRILKRLSPQSQQATLNGSAMRAGAFAILGQFLRFWLRDDASIAPAFALSLIPLRRALGLATDHVHADVRCGRRDPQHGGERLFKRAPRRGRPTPPSQRAQFILLKDGRSTTYHVIRSSHSPALRRQLQALRRLSAPRPISGRRLLGQVRALRPQRLLSALGGYTDRALRKSFMTRPRSATKIASASSRPMRPCRRQGAVPDGDIPQRNRARRRGARPQARREAKF
jgi:hypothetical protein